MSKFTTAVNNPTLLIRIHAAFMAFFFLLAFPAALLWANSVPFLVALSVWALIAGHWAAYQAVYAQREEQRDNDVDFDDLDERIDQIDTKLDRLIALQTNIDPLPEECL